MEMEIRPDAYNVAILAQYDHLSISSKDGFSNIQFFTREPFQKMSREEKIMSAICYLLKFARENVRDTSSLLIKATKHEDWYLNI